MDIKCPGADGRFLRVGIYKCANCGYEVEIFSDEEMVLCPKCKNKVYREKAPSCIDWCKYASQCIGEERWLELKKYFDKKEDKI